MSVESDSRATSAAPPVQTTAQALVAGLAAHGVDCVFGLPGAQTYPLFDALAERSSAISLIVARHEQACAYMALGYAQSTGRPGVCSVVPGPGVLNACAGLLTARGTGSPVVALTGEVPTDYLGRGFGHLHEMPDQLATIRSIAKWAANVMEPAQVPGLIAEAFRQATSGRPGPTALAVPWDVLARSAPVGPTHPAAVATPPVNSAELSAATDLLADARHPMIMVGGGARHAAAAINQLATHLQAPVVSLRSGRGVVSDRDPLGFTCAAGFELWSGTDVLVAVGTRQELAWLHWPDRPAGLRTINIDIEPAQHERLQPTVAITADANDGATALLAAVQNVRAPAESRTDDFVEIKRHATAEQNAVLQPHLDYLRAIRDVLPDEGYFVEEVSQMGFSSIFGFPVYEPRHFITAGYQGTLGFGYPTSLGVKAAHRDAPVVSVTGDGGFLFGATELATAVQYGLDVVTIVFDNEAYGNVKLDQQRLYDRDYGSTLRNPDFVDLARAFGADGYRATTPGELRQTLDIALAKGNPAVVHVPMPLDSSASPWQFIRPATRRSGQTPTA